MLADFEVIDLFAGPGGWDVAAHRLGLDPMGIEFDHAACETRRAAGLATLEGDVTEYGPADFPLARGLIASPPCQTFSAAGKGAGRKALDTVLTILVEMVGGRRVAPGDFDDPRTALVLEPLRWILDAHQAGRPARWVALEQVPTVLPVWKAYGAVMRELGYSVATGNLQAEQFGVPQTRKRAILIASLDRQVSLPTPTHSRYHTRSPQRLDTGVLPWVSMAEALGWEGFAQEAQQGMGMLARAGRYERPRRDDDQPSFTITGADGGGSARLRMVSNFGKGAQWVARFGNQDHSAERTPDQPAATIRYGERANALDWVQTRPATTVVGSFSPETIAAPGYRVSTADGSRQNAPGSVRVSVQEAALLQSFPSDYPWQGSKTKQYQQVGNAIPPKLAEAILRSVLTPLR